jgi:iron complex transport system substrate-binding protein
MKAKSVIAAVLVLSIAASALTGCKANSSSNSKDSISITDLAGRNVTMKKPAEKVVLSLAQDIIDYAAIYGPGFMKTIVGMGLDLKQTNADMFNKYKEKFPEIDNIPTVGIAYAGTFDTEKTLSLHPDLVIFSISEKAGLKSTDLPLLEQAGISVVFTDFMTETPENSRASAILEGKVLGKDNRALELADFYTTEVNKVYSRLAKLSSPKPKVYVEYGSAGPAKYGMTSAKTFMWGAMVNKAGGYNIANDLAGGGYININPEYLFAQDPAVIIFTGIRGLSGKPDALSMGYHSTPDETRSQFNKFIQRPGWANLSAVKNKRVYAVCHAMARNLADFTALQYFAKLLYPTEFADLDPEKSLKEYHEKYLPVDYSGVWFISLDK